MQLTKLLGVSPVDTVLGAMEDKDIIDEFYKHYCHDFIREVHLVTHAESVKEYKVSNCFSGMFTSV